MRIAMLNISILNKSTTAFLSMIPKNTPLEKHTKKWMTIRRDGWYPSRALKFGEETIIYDKLFFANSNDVVL